MIESSMIRSGTISQKKEASLQLFKNEPDLLEYFAGDLVE
jgi:hypothetical protein